ncbi:MAG: hypothetical protein JWO80_6276, partial [Bryobacterales bacterium]|nr:hypothetical protein [Bryobacterales bacterium]
FSSGRSLEFVATFSTTDGSQHAGFGVDFSSAPWAIFSTRGGGSLYARTNNGSQTIDTLIAGTWLGAAHRYRIDWNTGNVVFSIDGTQVTTTALSITANMRPLISDLFVGGSVIKVDWVHMSPYSTPAVFTSRVLDAGSVTSWSSISWTADVPAGTSLTMSVRTGNTPVPDGTWSAFTTPTTQSGTPVSGSSRYIQYRATLSTSNTTQTVTLRDVTIR